MATARIARDGTATARIRARMPMFIFHEYTMEEELSGSLFRLELLWMAPRRWMRSRYARSELWTPIAVGPFVLAYRVTFEITSSGTPLPAASVPLTLDTARVRTRMPMFLARRMQLEHPTTRELFEVDFLWMPRGRWRRADYSAAGCWRPLPVGPFILAYRVTF